MPARGFPVTRAIISLSLTIILSFLALACGGGASPSNVGSNDVAVPTQSPTPTPVSVSADALQSEKELNEVAWTSKYNDNLALITGSISSITEAGNKYDVKLETDNFTVSIVCKVDETNEPAVLSLQRGQTVTVLGRVTDDGIIDIVVEDCSIASSNRAAQPTSQAQISSTEPPRLLTPVAAVTAQAAPATKSPTATLAPRDTIAATAQVPALTAPTPTRTPTMLQTPTAMPTPIPAGTSLDNPVAAGEVLQGSDGTEILVTGILEDATDTVLSANTYNDPPESGNRFYMATVAVSYLSGTDSINVSGADYSLIGDNRMVYTPFEHSCGVTSNELEAELFPSGKTTGNVCFQVASGDENFVLIHEPFLSFEGKRRFLSLDAQKPSSVGNLTTVALPTPDPASMALPSGMTLDNPVAAGEVLQGSNGTETNVTDVLEDATHFILSANPYNDPRESGNRFYMVTVAVSNASGTDSVNVTESDYSLVGDNRVVYTPFGHSCGVTPDELEAELFPGGKTTGNICFEVASDDEIFVLIHEPFLSFEGERRFLSLE